MNIVYILLRIYSMGFSATHRELTHCNSQNAVRAAVPVVSFFKQMEKPLHQLLPPSTRYAQC